MINAEDKNKIRLKFLILTFVSNQTKWMVLKHLKVSIYQYIGLVKSLSLRLTIDNDQLHVEGPLLVKDFQ